MKERDGILIKRKQMVIPKALQVQARYLEVHMMRSTGMTELRKVLNETMRMHGVPTEVWSGLFKDSS